MNVKATFFMRVYNVESYLLRRAVESILNQTEHNFRFIIQDNGSTDGSATILKEYADLDRRIVYFRNEINSQPTLEEMHEREVVLYENFEGCDSEFFAIIDSDDYYEDDFLEKCSCYAIENHLDIVFTGYKQEYTDGILRTVKCPPTIICRTDSISEQVFQQEYPMFRTLWGTLYSAKLWRRYWMLLDVDRPEYMRSGLDTYINLKILAEIDRFASLSEALYTQTLRKDSIYNKNININRLKEADDLFLLGIALAQKSCILNENIITLLTSIYYYYLEDTIIGLVYNQDIGNNVTCEAGEILKESQIFNMLAEKNKDLKNLQILLERKGLK
jgi:glycosyltransferase involved in cell wall biosynthesis